MSVEQAATAATAPAGSPGRRGETRILGPPAVTLGLLAGCAKIVVPSSAGLVDVVLMSRRHLVIWSSDGAMVKTLRALACQTF